MPNSTRFEICCELSGKCATIQKSEDMDVEKPGRFLKPLTPKEAELLILRLEEEHEKMKEKLLYQELTVQKTKDEIERKANQLRMLKEDVRNARRFADDPLAVLRAELKKTGIKSAKIEDALDDIARMLSSDL